VSWEPTYLIWDGGWGERKKEIKIIKVSQVTERINKERPILK
jgi:hypothetical protein